MNLQEVIAHQRSVADFVLEKLFTIDPFSIVAGGAPRDWYFYKEAADIDVFFYVSRNTQLYVIQAMLEAAGFIIKERKDGHSLPEIYKMNPKLRSVFNLEIEGVPVQLMLMTEPTHSVIDTFPLSICKAWYKRGAIRTERDFVRTLKHKVIFKTNDLYANGHVYLKKILDKFPEYKYCESVVKFAEHIIDN